MSQNIANATGDAVPTPFKRPKSVTEEEIRDILRKAILSVKNAEEEKRRPKPRVGKCKVCGGKVTEEFESHSDTPSSMIPLGPGSRNYYYQRSTGLHCTECGISYHKLP